MDGAVTYVDVHRTDASRRRAFPCHVTRPTFGVRLLLKSRGSCLPSCKELGTRQVLPAQIFGFRR